MIPMDIIFYIKIDTRKVRYLPIVFCSLVNRKIYERDNK